MSKREIDYYCYRIIAGHPKSEFACDLGELCEILHVSIEQSERDWQDAAARYLANLL